MHRHRLLLLVALGTLLLFPGLLDWWLFGNHHWLTPFIIWGLLIALVALAEWRQRHHEL
ncbi:hypothetical protein [Marinobacterium stanieri]|uniref:Uncharacterized protein n=1 Tax=Marinobacterium stanieri TaxID=49186 RepID=A0A1N6XQ53_9GAMM|nr:hypothetical protein [Marinobacterium stanieri]SIR04331.1 hypothetical protein SAMN05421647_11533 [Marinobacterium stanieri]